MEEFRDFTDEVASGKGVTADVGGEDGGGFDADGDGTAVGGFFHNPAAILGGEITGVELPEV